MCIRDSFWTLGTVCRIGSQCCDDGIERLGGVDLCSSLDHVLSEFVDLSPAPRVGLAGVDRRSEVLAGGKDVAFFANAVDARRVGPIGCLEVFGEVREHGGGL